MVFGLVLLATPGVVFEQWAEGRDFERYTPPGKLYDVGDHKLHLRCEGVGSPTVILEASGLGSALSFDEVLPLLAKRTRVCAYDRAGMGFSERAGRALTSKALAEELEGLLAAAKVEPPYVLAGASIGGLTVEMFARRNPQAVAGLV
ncbi:MAG: alpha/beta hydrolase, partial [Myxococcaceae bacterium]|nr:alpha/beta hydrolase [Myxococcaceae bacterium]